MRSKKTVAWCVLALGLGAPPSWSADDLMTSQLIDEARAWQDKNRDDIAAPLWTRLLLVQPTHPQALVQLAGIEVRAGNLAAARALYQRAAQLRPPPRGLSELSAALAAAQETPSKETLPKVATPVEPAERPKAPAPAAKAPPVSAPPTPNPSPGKKPDSLLLKFSDHIDPRP